ISILPAQFGIQFLLLRDPPPLVYAYAYNARRWGMSEVTERVSQGAGRREKPTRGWRALKWLGLSLAALVGMAQIGAIVQEAIPTGALSVTTLYAPGQVFSSPSQTSDALRQWAAVSHQSGPLALWLYLHLAFDGLFIIGYGALGFTTLPKTEK